MDITEQPNHTSNGHRDYVGKQIITRYMPPPLFLSPLLHPMLLLHFLFDYFRFGWRFPSSPSSSSRSGIKLTKFEIRSLVLFNYLIILSCHNNCKTSANYGRHHPAKIAVQRFRRSMLEFDSLHFPLKVMTDFLVQLYHCDDYYLALTHTHLTGVLY